MERINMPNLSDEVFHLNGEKLTPMPLRSMRKGLLGKSLEDALQTFFENYPQIIPGKQIDPGSEDPPRFVLLRREMPVGGWSLDHLFADQRGVLTLVETKLFQNPESRREVIGQIIEYAANAKEVWLGGNARQKAMEFWSSQKPPKELDQVIQTEFGSELDIEDFWKNVEENLKNGKMRLIIATDELRPEVRRMIEYLNNEMQSTEVLGLELKFYGERADSMVLVPRLVGQSQSAIDKKGSGGNIKWTLDKLREAYGELGDNELGRKLRKVLDWAVDKGIFKVAIAKFPTFGLQGKSKDRIVSFFSNGDVYCVLNEKFYLGEAEERDELVGKLKELQFLDRDLDPQQVVSGRNLTKKLFEMTDDELDNLLDAFTMYCV
jgi:hypothetical protein